jgi:aminopeptidase
LAFGFSFRENFERGSELNSDEIAVLGGNDSLTHVDVMIGRAHIEVDGIVEDGSRQPLIRGGHWTF